MRPRLMLSTLCLALAGCVYDPWDGMRETSFERTPPAEVARPEPVVCRLEFDGKVYTLDGKDTEAAWELLRMLAKLEAGMTDVRRLKDHIAQHNRNMERTLGREGVNHPDALWEERNQIDYDYYYDKHAFYVDEHNAVAEECRALYDAIVRHLEKHHNPELDGAIRFLTR